MVLDRRSQAATDVAFVPDLMEACSNEHATLCSTPGVEVRTRAPAGWVTKHARRRNATQGAAGVLQPFTSYRGAKHAAGDAKGMEVAASVLDYSMSDATHSPMVLGKPFSAAPFSCSSQRPSQPLQLLVSLYRSLGGSALL